MTSKWAKGTGGQGTPTVVVPDDTTYGFDSTYSGASPPIENLSPPIKVGSTLNLGAPPPVARQNMAVRRLTPLECERLQGFPDDHTRWADDGSELADSHRYRMCGNAITANVARWVCEQINIAEARRG